MTLEPSSPISGPAPAQGHADRDLRSSFYPPVASTTFGTTWAHVHSPLGWHQLRAPQSPQERLQALDTPPVDRQQPHNTLDHSCAEQCTNISSRTAEAQQPAVSGSGSRSTHRGANASFGKWTLQPVMYQRCHIRHPTRRLSLDPRPWTRSYSLCVLVPPATLPALPSGCPGFWPHPPVRLRLLGPLSQQPWDWAPLSSFGGEGNGTPLQYSCLENPMDGGAWWAAVHGVAKSQMPLSDFTFTFHFPALEKEMATTPVFLPGESQGRGSLVGCRLWGRTESDTTEATQQQQQQQ